jgi:uncharacterized repeat protein (TIGR01451 family)
MGDTFAYQIVIKNAPGAGGTSMILSDLDETMPTGFTWNSGLGVSGCGASSPTLTGTNPDVVHVTLSQTLGNNQSCTVVIWADADVPGVSIPNPEVSVNYTISGASGSQNFTLTNGGPITVQTVTPTSTATPTRTPTSTRTATRTPTNTPTPTPTVALAITKSVSPSSVVSGSTVTYTIRVANNSSQTVYIDQIYDTFPSGWTWVTNSTAATGGSACSLFTNGSVSGGVLYIDTNRSDNIDPGNYCEVTTQFVANGSGTADNPQIQVDWRLNGSGTGPVSSNYAYNLATANFVTATATSTPTPQPCTSVNATDVGSVAAGQGTYVVINKTSGTGTSLVASWSMNGGAGNRRKLALYVYSGMPYGAGVGTATSVLGGSLNSVVNASAVTTATLTTTGLAAGTYTVLFWSNDTSSANTNSASTTC